MCFGRSKAVIVDTVKTANVHQWRWIKYANARCVWPIDRLAWIWSNMRVLSRSGAPSWHKQSPVIIWFYLFFACHPGIHCFDLVCGSDEIIDSRPLLQLNLILFVFALENIATYLLLTKHTASHWFVSNKYYCASKRMGAMCLIAVCLFRSFFSASRKCAHFLHRRRRDGNVCWHHFCQQPKWTTVDWEFVFMFVETNTAV